MTTDPIATARAMIEHLTGYTPKPWAVDMSYQWPSKVRAAPPFNDRWICDASSGLPHTLSNARLIAAAPDLRDMVATLADALEAERAKVAAAYEAAATEADQVVAIWEAVMAIRALTPADAQTALDKLLAEARAEGWRAGREVALAKIDRHVDDLRGLPSSSHQITANEFECMAEIIRALPEPKENSHD